MSYVFEMKVGKYTYLYEGTSFRNKEGKPRSEKLSVGKVDPKQGFPERFPKVLNDTFIVQSNNRIHDKHT